MSALGRKKESEVTGGEHAPEQVISKLIYVDVAKAQQHKRY